MNHLSSLERLKLRLKDEGMPNTLKYCTCVTYYSVQKLFRDAYIDLRYSGRVLNGNKKTAYKHWWANDVYHTDYTAMPIIFRFVDFSPDDVLVDVGCGKGRIINYWLKRGCHNRIVGLELDPEVASQSALQFARWTNVGIIQGDAIENLPADGTIFYFYNPFEMPKVIEFEQKLAALPERFGKRVTVVYYNPKSIDVFRNGRWSISYINFEQSLGIKRWGRLNKYHDLAILTRL